MFCRAVPYWLYELPEYPWPSHLKATASAKGLVPAESVQTYLEEYAAKFSLLEYIQFSSEVTLISQSTGKFDCPALPKAGQDSSVLGLLTSLIPVKWLCQKPPALCSAGIQLQAFSQQADDGTPGL